ncbi:MAG TPA: AIR synthase related protein [Actinomycetota bacterium]|nr:AIR synthase related protein [Actinomycetota bacterium]
MDELDEVAAGFRSSRGLAGKASIGLVTEVLGGTDWLSGPGDDTAVVACGAEQILVAGEAIWPPLVSADPFGAGVAAVVANVNDVAAMGGRPLALVDHVTAPEAVARRVLEGIRHAAGIYRVPVVGGHLTIWDGDPSVSASIVGSVTQPLSSTRVAAGQVCLLAACLAGRLRGDFPIFTSIEERTAELGDDVRLLADLADEGLVAAAKDVSMAGILGSLAMLLEPSGCGARVDLAAIPKPPQMAIAAWTAVFPTYGFLLTADPRHADAVRDGFEERGLACSVLGPVDGTGRLRATLEGRDAELLDLRTQVVTGLSTARPAVAAGSTSSGADGPGSPSGPPPGSTPGI